MPDPGHIELERTVDSIIVGLRHRKQMGDLEKLKKSIGDLGLLQPITIAPDGVLLCGRRRLEAVKELGYRTVRVWVRTGISDELNSLLALQDENALHEPLSDVEAADLYRELKKVRAEDAARRQRASRFGATPLGDQDSDGGEGHGGDDSSPPLPAGKTREQVALMVTGTQSHQRLERINTIQDIAADVARPEHVRRLAKQGIDQINNGAPVSRTYEQVMAVANEAESAARPTVDLDELARQALARITQPRTRRTSDSPKTSRSLRSFALMWIDMDGWWTHYDAAEIGASLKETDWVRFERIVHATNEFADAARRERAARPEQATA